VVIEGTTQTLDAHEVPSDMGDAFAAATGFDPRTLFTRYLYFRIDPRRMQASREADELEGPRAHALRPLARGLTRR
jgi:hypothetical protein